MYLLTPTYQSGTTDPRAFSERINLRPLIKDRIIKSRRKKCGMWRFFGDESMLFVCFSLSDERVCLILITMYVVGMEKDGR